MKILLSLLFAITSLLLSSNLHACSIMYYINQKTGDIYVVNNEDYWYDTKTYIQTEPKSTNEYARLWYGWDKFAQGGVNEAGLFFDGTATPKQIIINGYTDPKGRNVGDEILASCTTIEQAITFLEDEKIMITEGHIMFGDSSGHAIVIEWVNGQKEIIQMNGNKLIATNFLLSDTTAGNYPCPRYNSIEERVQELEASEDTISLSAIGNTFGGSAQLPRKGENGKIGGTLYTSFINISKMKLIIVYKLDNSKVTQIDLRETFSNPKRKKIKLK